MLKNLKDSDVEAMCNYRNDPACNKYQRYDDTTPAYINTLIKKYSSSKFGELEEEQHFAVVNNETKIIVGDVTIFYNENDNCFTIGITIAPENQNKGYAYEILSEIIEKLHNKYPKIEFVALIEKENEKSINLFKKLGFTEECYSEKLASYVYTKYGECNG